MRRCVPGLRSRLFRLLVYRPSMYSCYIYGYYHVYGGSRTRWCSDQKPVKGRRKTLTSNHPADPRLIENGAGISNETPEIPEIPETIETYETPDISHEHTRISSTSQNLDFLTMPISPLIPTYIDPTEFQSKPSTNVKKTATTKSTSPPPVQQKPWTLGIEAFLDNCRDLMDNGQPESLSDLKQLFLRGSAANLQLDPSFVGTMMTRLVEDNQYSLACVFFQLFANEIHSAKLISQGIKAAYKSGNSLECERIFSHNLGRVEFSSAALRMVLKNFIQDHNMTVAKELYYQLIEISSGDLAVQTQFFTIYVQGIIQVSKDIAELGDAFAKWNARIIDSPEPRIYALILEGYLKLDASEQFKKLFEKVVRDETLLNSKEIKTAGLLHMLCRPDQHDVVRHLNLVSDQPDIDFNSLMKDAVFYHSQRGDLNALRTMLECMRALNIDINIYFANNILRCFIQSDNEFKGIEYMKTWPRDSIVGNSSSIGLFWMAMLRKFPHRGRKINSIISTLRRDFPSLFHRQTSSSSSSSSFSDSILSSFSTVVHETNTRHTTKKNILINSVHEYSSLNQIRQIQTHFKFRQPQKALAVFSQYLRRGLVPPRVMFNTLIHGLYKFGYNTEAENALSLMLELGHPLDIALKTILIIQKSRNLRNISKQYSFDQIRSMSTRLFYDFIQTNEGELNLKSTSAIAFELIKLENYQLAVSMLDYFRGPTGTVNAQNHDGTSLAGILKACSLTGDFETAIDILDQLVRAPPEIVLYPYFFVQLKACRKAAEAKDLPEVVKALRSLDAECHRYAKDVDKYVDSLLAMGQKTFESWTNTT